MINNYNFFKNDAQNIKAINYNNNNPIINNNMLINQNNKANDKKVSFNNNVVEINVESYKDYNKLMSYNEEDIYENLQRKDSLSNFIEKKNLDNKNNNYNYNNYNNNLVQIRPRKENECCCLIF